MFKKIKKYINSKISNKRFKRSIKKEKRKIFIDDLNYEKKFKKRKKIVLNFPNFSEFFNKQNLKNFYIWLFLFLTISLIIILFSPLLNIQKIEIETDSSSKNLIDLNIAYKSVDSFRNKNILLLSQSEIWNSIINYQKNINKIEINKYFFSPKITIKLYSYGAIYYTIISWKKYLITKNWVFIQTNNKDLNGLKEINIELSNNYNDLYDYKKILQEKYTDKIMSIEKEISQNIVWLQIKKIYYFEKEREVHFDINNNIKLIFDINTDDTEEQVKKLAIFNKEHLNIAQTNTIFYIDLRVPNKIYYCETENILICEKTLQSIYNLYKNS